MPVLEQKAIDAGKPPPPSAFRDALREHGWKWLVYELAVLVALAVASMVWDGRRGLQNRSPARRQSPTTRHPRPA